MPIVLSVAGAAALIVIAYALIREHSPESAASGLRAVRDLAAVVLLCVEAVEGIVDVLARPARADSPSHQLARSGLRLRIRRTDYDLEEDEL